MSVVFAYLAHNAADLLLNVTFGLAVYLIARLLKASPAAALVFAAIPFGVILLLQHPAIPARLLAMLN